MGRGLGAPAVTLWLIAATVGVFVGGPILIGLALSRPDRCCSCRRRCETAPGVQIIRATGRYLCTTCLATTEPNERFR